MCSRYMLSLTKDFNALLCLVLSIELYVLTFYLLPQIFFLLIEIIYPSFRNFNGILNNWVIYFITNCNCYKSLTIINIIIGNRWHFIIIIWIIKINYFLSYSNVDYLFIIYGYFLNSPVICRQIKATYIWLNMCSIFSHSHN